MINQFHLAIQYFTTLHTSTYLTLLGILLVALCNSAVVRSLKPVFKRWESKYGVEAEKLAVGAIGLLALAFSALSSYLSNNPLPLHVVGSNTAVIGFLSFVVYHFGGKNGFDAIAAVLQDLKQYITTGQLPGGSPKS